MAERILLAETEGKVLKLILNDPATRNAFGSELMGQLLEELDRFAKSPDLRALVITACGPVFSSGANLRGFQRGIDEGRVEPEPTPGKLWMQGGTSSLGEGLRA